MPAAVANLRGRNGLPPAKKAKLTQSPATVRQNGLKALVNGNAVKPTAQINGVKNAQANRVDDATAVVEGPGDIQMGDAGNEVIEISSNEEDSEDDEEIEDLTQAGAQEEVPTTNGNAEDEDGAEAEDLTFGDRLRAEGPEPVRESRIINVEDADPDTRAALTTTQNRSLAPPTDAHSLKTVLEQALRTNDTERLESCLSVIDAESVYATVERLESRFVGVLLQRLAERLHRKPGRAGILMAWVQYSLAAHGGYLASQPQLVKQLSALNKVLKERSSGLMPLMSLKGRLDMLQAQLDLRKRNQQRADDENDEVIYIEGEHDYVSSDEEADQVDATPRATQKRLRQDEDEDDSSNDEMTYNVEVNEDEEGSEDSDDEDLIDDEAEETDNDELSDPESEDLELNGEGVSESEEEVRPERRSTAARNRR